MDNKLSELSKPVGFVSKQAQALLKSGDTASVRPFFDVQGSSPLYSQGYVSALLARIEELEWRELNSTELKELLTWHPTERSAATDPILWAAMRNKINFTLARVAADEAKKEQSNG
ncbi:hypothetical protein P9A06_25650 [Serratia marcescens]|uniref:hypothetical protein n=1 Tax=Serratia marcescens TaxID=615 RepID=UPI003204680B